MVSPFTLVTLAESSVRYGSFQNIFSAGMSSLLSFYDLPRENVLKFPLLQHWDTINKHPIETRCKLFWIFKGSRVSENVLVKKNHVSIKTLFDLSAIP